MMGTKPQQDLTAILGRARAGDQRAKGELIALVYDELRQVAARLMRPSMRSGGASGPVPGRRQKPDWHS